MIDLSTSPFHLTADEIAWVEETLEGMTPVEKIWQLFADPLMGMDKEHLLAYLGQRPLGGCSFRASQFSDEEAREILGAVQNSMKIPMLVSADCGTGANGRLRDGTFIATAAQAGAAADSAKIAYNTGLAACRELGAVGFNWAFEPVGDLLLNWRNCLVNTRAFSADPDKVIECLDAFNLAADENEFVSCLKHFPGDGWEERDQHLVPGNNGLDCETWDSTYGKIYRHAIAKDVKSIMIGHFTLPAWQRRLNPDLADSEMDTACLSPELIQGLLRDRLGFNGLIVTDQTTMIGFYTQRREDALPLAINAGCDMILGINDPDEDYASIEKAIESGILSMQRVEDAIRRILATKASIKLHIKKAAGTLIPPIEKMSYIGCEEHRKFAEEASDAAITLVKDTRHQLPIRPETHKRLLVYVLSSSKISNQFGAGVAGGGDEGLPTSVKTILEQEGFAVTLWDESTLSSSVGGRSGTVKGKISEFTKRFDAVLLFADLTKFASVNSIRIEWPSPMASISPWFVPEIPTAFISLNLTNHLIDVPRVPIFINAYNNQPETIRLLAKKLMGESQFMGKYEETVWCGKWDTHF